MNFETIILEFNEKIAIIKLNRPDKLNALNKQMFDDISNAVDLINDNNEIKAVVVTGSGEKAFAEVRKQYPIRNPEE
jgi:enoyl-CoA hydratase